MGRKCSATIFWHFSRNFLEFFCEVTPTLVLTFGDISLGFRIQGGWISSLYALSPVCNGFLRITWGVTPTGRLAASMRRGMEQPALFCLLSRKCMQFHPCSLSNTLSKIQRTKIPQNKTGTHVLKSVHLIKVYFMVFISFKIWIMSIYHDIQWSASSSEF